MKVVMSPVNLVVDKTDSGKRLDVLLASRYPSFSRAFLAHQITAGAITIQGKIVKPGYRVKSGDRVKGSISTQEPLALSPEPIPIEILYEDDHLVVINKQPGLVVHPAPGHSGGTLVNAMLHHCPMLEGIGEKSRPGIVHRLDKDTSGVLVVAKSKDAFDRLAEQFKAREVQKRYLALVCGCVKEERGTVSFSIGRHPVERKKMSTRSSMARSAETGWMVKERFDIATFLELDLKTGRTHQIRVHCAAIGHPVAGDPVYGGRRCLDTFGKGKGKSLLAKIRRQMLHSHRLYLKHPTTGAGMSFEAPIPADMADLMQALRTIRDRKS